MPYRKVSYIEQIIYLLKFKLKTWRKKNERRKYL